MQQILTKARPILTAVAVSVAVMFSAQSAHADAITTKVNGRALGFDVPPVIEQGRALVPVRGILEPLGATLEWNQESQTVSANLSGHAIKLAIGAKTATVDGGSVTLDVPARIVAGRTLVPLRFFAESLGMQVAWDETSRTIDIIARAEVVSRDGSAASGRRGALMAQQARKLVGKPYAWGGTSPNTGFDCSGFVYYNAKQVGVTLPRTSFEMFQSGIPVEKANLQAGDLVFFTTYAAGASHVAIYDGNGNFIHAENPEQGVVVTPLSREWWATRYLGARRVVR